MREFGFLLILLAGPAMAQEPPARSPLKSVLGAVGMATDPPPARDFVRQSRPRDMGFIPVGVRRPDRGTKVKSVAELQAMEASLEAERLRHDRLSGRPPPPDGAAPPKPSRRRTR